MGTYISLIDWTDQGIKGFRDTLERAEMAGKVAEQLGGKLKDVYWTVGEHDIVAIAEFPDDEAATAYLLSLGSLGNVRTKSLKAFDKEEMRRIIDRAT